MHINISKVNFKSISINIAKVDFGRYDSGGSEEYYGMYITPASDSAINVTPNDSYYTLHGKYLKYSLNGKKWNDWNSSVTIEPEKKMYLKGEDDYVWNESTNGKLIKSDGYYNVGGDISSLTNEIVEVKNSIFRSLFYNDSYIKDASNLILASETLADYCYTSMFQGCTSLTTAPALNATTLASNCYLSMFGYCSSLTTAPELPATTLAENCYYSMFRGCTSLTTAPKLPATTLAKSCYEYMFEGCTSLTTAPALNATTLASNCYFSMFQGCTSLTTAPELPATTLADYCYTNMFYDCSSLTTAPELPATTLKRRCYEYMFNGCTSLNNITMLATDISADGCLTDWVSGVAPTGTFTKAAEMTSLPTGVNGIPSGWTVKDYTDYMTLSALGDGKITITIPAAINSSYATSLSYSKDRSTWNETVVDDTAQTITIPVTSGENVYLKGIAKQLGKDNSFININSTAGINASGNIMSLLYGDDYKDKVAFKSGSEYIFKSLFSGNAHLINAKDLVLPATTLASYCYSFMFGYCSSLTTAPELPATTLADYCYSFMFQGCSSLTTAPELPATTLADYCYMDMFTNCPSLTTAPALNATTLASNCYFSMFMYCRSLKTAPALPATTLANSCYRFMFDDCSSLTTAPALPATTLAKSCYEYMFQGCSSLTTAPKLPATTLAESCYGSMFKGCTSLTTAPELPATTLAYGCYYYMFYNCKNLNSITMLATDISADGCLTDWVSGVAPTGTFTKAASMTTLPTGVNGIPSGWTVVDYGALDYSSEYMTLSALGDGEITITIPEELNSSYATSLSYSKDRSTWNETVVDDTAQTITIPVTNGENVYLKGIAKQLGNSSTGVNINSTANINASGNIMSLLYGDDYKDKVAFKSGSEYIFKSLFSGNAHLINAKDLVLPVTTLASNCYFSMFYDCSSLTTAPALPATTLASYCYSFMFNGCTSLTSAPALPATTLAKSCYEYMFMYCTSLTTAPKLPATTLANSCYSFMFTSCSSLTTAPELPATTLAKNCYYCMFYYCKNLNSITMLATDISADGCLFGWVDGVSSTGTFTKAASMTSLPTGTSGIPEGWTVVDYGAA